MKSCRTSEKASPGCKGVPRFSTLAVLLCLLGINSLHAQWIQLADRNRVRAVEKSPDGGALWYATTGGLVRLDLARGVTQSFGRSEGLPSTDLTALYMASDGSLVVGSRDMGLLVQAGAGRWVRIGVFDGLPDSRVLCLTASGTAEAQRFWAGTASGAREFSLSGGIVNVVRGGLTVLERNEINSIAAAGDGSVWFATSGGLWRMDSRLAFRRFGVAEGVGSLAVSRVSAGPGGSLYAAWQDSLKVFDGTGFVPSGAPARRETVSDLRLLGEGAAARLALAAGGRVYILAEGQWSVVGGVAAAPVALGPALYDNGPPVLGSEASGLSVPDAGGAYTSLSLPGPLYNLLTRVAVDNRGTVWTSSASDATPRQSVGVNRWDGKAWTHYTENNSPLLMNMISSLNAAPDGRMYLGTWFGPTVVGSGGFNILDDHATADSSDDEWQTYIANETPLSMGVIRGRMAFDSAGGVWVGSQFNQNQPGGLEYFDPKTRTFSSYSDRLAQRAVRCVAVDGLGDVWIGYLNQGLGLIPGGLAGGADPRVVQTFRDALGEVGVLDLAVDPANRLWIVTPAKTVVLNFQEDATNESRYNYTEVKPEGFAGLAATAVALQGLEAAWFATADGLWRYGIQDQSWIVFNRGNSGIASDQLNDVAVDVARGVLWAATSGGLAALSLKDSREGGGTHQKIIVRPNPWRPAAQGLLALSGIPPYSRVSIYTVSGETVRRFDSRDTSAGLLLWDGVNQGGRPCASGVYVILARPPEGYELTAKVALIR